jgi:small subunit ribosomal protein S9
MNKIENIISGVGKRKTSVAKVFLKEGGKGDIIVNNKNWENFFSGVGEEKELIKKPLLLLNLNNVYDLSISVKGGGISSQLDAIKLAISKALASLNTDYRQLLNQQFLLTRDARIKERRKYGLKKARKASQYSKR